MSSNLVKRFRRWVIGAVAFGALFFLGGSLWAGLRPMQDQLSRFQWALAVPIVGLTLLNYGLRFLKWRYLLQRVGVKLPFWEDATTFAAGLAMVISPGKAGELLKPYVVRARTGTPMARTIPVLITERLTDGIAMLILAGLSVTTYAADRAHYITIPAVLTALGLAVLASERLTGLCLRLLERIPGLRRLAPKVSVLLSAMRTCTAPAPLLLTVLLSLVAWGAECVGFLLTFWGLGLDPGLEVAVFLYAFATVAGGAMPGGLGVADTALAGGAIALIPDIPEAAAVAAAMLIRLATLWLGVGLGAAALFRVSSMLDGELTLDGGASEPRQDG